MAFYYADGVWHDAGKDRSRSEELLGLLCDEVGFVLERYGCERVAKDTWLCRGVTVTFAPSPRA